MLIRSYNTWDEHDVNILRKLYPHDNITELAELLDRKRELVKTKAHSLNIKRAHTPGHVSYVIALKKSDNNRVMINRTVKAQSGSRYFRDQIVNELNNRHYNKLITGEWYLSVTNNLEKFKDTTLF